jgi:tetratricopeptide (TPR) repeat protein
MKTPILWTTLSFILMALIAVCSGLAQQADNTTIRRYSEEAEQAIKDKNLAAATAALEKLAQLTPDEPEVHANLGFVYYYGGDYENAAKAFKRALQLKPEMPEAKLMLGICYAHTGRFKESISTLEPAFRQPPNPEVGREIGLQLLHGYRGLGQNERAGKVAEEMIRRYPNDPEILYEVSRLYADRSLQVMLRLVDVAPNSAWKRMAFGQVHESQKQYDLAIVEYQNALKIDPKLPTLHYHLGHAILLNSPDKDSARDEALQEFQRELAIDPRNPDAEYELGEIYRERGQLEQAREHFLQATQNDSRFEEAQVALARVLISLGNPKEAVPHLETAVKLEPTDEVPHFLLARVYKTMGEATQSETEMQLYQKYHEIGDPHPEYRKELPPADPDGPTGQSPNAPGKDAP